MKSQNGMKKDEVGVVVSILGVELWWECDHHEEESWNAEMLKCRKVEMSKRWKVSVV
jgi:hypothetical protein